MPKCCFYTPAIISEYFRPARPAVIAWAAVFAVVSFAFRFAIVGKLTVKKYRRYER